MIFSWCESCTPVVEVKVADVESTGRRGSEQRERVATTESEEGA